MKNEFKAFASLLSAQPSDADSIAAWMAERETEREVDLMNKEEVRQDNERLATVADAYDTTIAQSQIRILSKCCTSNPDIIPYVAVIDKWDEGMWLIIPFSRYNTPATPGEMKTGMATRGLRVLQAWNGRTVQETLLKNSYLFGELPEKVCACALKLFRSQFTGANLPESFDVECGAPIEVVGDPRHEYLAEEIARLQPLSDAVMAEAEHPNVTMQLVKDGLSRDEKSRIRTQYNFGVIRLAAATLDKNPEVPLINDREAWRGECRMVSEFIEFVKGDDPVFVRFKLDAQFKDTIKEGPSRVEAYKAANQDLILVGDGEMFEEDGEIFARVKIGEVNPTVSVKAEEMVLLIRK